MIDWTMGDIPFTQEWFLLHPRCWVCDTRWSLVVIERKAAFVNEPDVEMTMPVGYCGTCLRNDWEPTWLLVKKGGK